MASFKGRVVEVKGSRITIDVKEEARMIRVGGTETFVGSSWLKGELPKEGAVVRANFHNKDRR